MDDNSKKPLICVCGPTGTGKSDLSVSLSERIDGEVVSCDSMQVYKGMDIGSAKIRPDEMRDIRHHMIDVAEPEDPFNISRYKDMALSAIEDILSRGNIPVLCGGTGFYMNSVLYGSDFTDDGHDEAYRKELSDFAEKNGNDALHEKLKEIDPESYQTIHANNVKRVIRALEYHHLTGLPISKHNEEEKQKRELLFDSLIFFLTDERARMYDRLDRRVDRMMEEGLLDEVKALYDRGLRSDDVSMQGLSYRQLIDFIEGKCTLDEAVFRIKLETRHYAKRQLTWFNRQLPEDTVRIDISDFSYDRAAILEKVLMITKEHYDIEG